jgi:hypothetical protein
MELLTHQIFESEAFLMGLCIHHAPSMRAKHGSGFGDILTVAVAVSVSVSISERRHFGPRWLGDPAAPDALRSGSSAPDEMRRQKLEDAGDDGCAHGAARRRVCAREIASGARCDERRLYG